MDLSSIVPGYHKVDVYCKDVLQSALLCFKAATEMDEDFWEYGETYRGFYEAMAKQRDELLSIIEGLIPGQKLQEHFDSVDEEKHIEVLKDINASIFESVMSLTDQYRASLAPDEDEQEKGKKRKEHEDRDMEENSGNSEECSNPRKKSEMPNSSFEVSPELLQPFDYSKISSMKDNNNPVSNEDNDVPSIMNTSMESLGALSDLEGVEPTINVANDVDVVHIATDIFHDDLPKAYDVDFVHMDHTYSMPAAAPKLDILDIVKPKLAVTESPNKSGYESSSDNLKTSSPPVRRSLRQQEREDRVQKEKESPPKEDIKLRKALPPDSVISPEEEILSSNLKTANNSSFDLVAENPLSISETKAHESVVDSPIKDKPNGVVPNNSLEKGIQQSSLPQIEKAGKLNPEISPRKHRLAGIIKDVLKGARVNINGSDFQPANIVSPVKTLQKSEECKNVVAKQTPVSKKTNNTLHKKLHNNLKSAKTKKVVLKNLQLPKKNNNMVKKEDPKVRVRHNSGKLTNRHSESEDQQLMNSSSVERKANKDKDKKSDLTTKLPRKKSLSFSEDKKEDGASASGKKRNLSFSEDKGEGSTPVSAKKRHLSFSEDKGESSTPASAKKRHLSVSEKDVHVTKPGLTPKPKIKPKKKILRSESISADLLGPALFSEPDVMVKVKTIEDPVASDAKADKSKTENKDEGSSTPVAACENEKPVEADVSELDLIKAEMQLEQNTKLAAVSEKSEQESQVKDAEVEPDSSDVKETYESPDNGDKPCEEAFKMDEGSDAIEESPVVEQQPEAVAESPIHEDEDEITPESPVSERLVIATSPEPEASRSRVQRNALMRSQKCSPSNIKDFLVTKNKTNASLSSQESQSPADDSASGKGTNRTIARGRQTAASKDKPAEETPQPSRKSTRTIQRKRQFDEDYSPEAPVRKRKQPNQTAKNDTPGSTKVEESPGTSTLSQRPTRKTASNMPTIVAELQSDESEDDDQEDNTEDSDESSESEWDSEDDPEKLWCICRKPHNNKFMIECDSCKDWFHGTCVSVTRQLGRQLEKEGKEWICPNCSKVTPAKGRGNTSAAAATNRLNQQTAGKRQQGVKKNVAALAKQTPVPSKTESISPKKPETSSKRIEIIRQSIMAKSQDPVKADKSNKITPKEKENPEKMQTRHPIPKNFVLKSRDPVRDKKDAAKSEKTPVKSVTPLKLDTPTTRSSASKVEKLEAGKADKSPTEKEPPAHVLPRKHILMREVTVVNNVVVQERKVVGVPVNQKDPQPKVTSGNVSPTKTTRKQEFSQGAKVAITKNTVAGKDTKVLKETLVLNKFPNCVVCNKFVGPRSFYCSDQCLEKYTSESVKLVQNAMKPSDDPNSTKVVCLQRVTNNVLKDSSAPTVSELVPWLKVNQSYAVVRPPTFVMNKKESKADSEAERSDDPEETAKANVRQNARKTLKNILLERCQNADDIKMSEEEVLKICTKIEEELHRKFKENSFKYRSKYRSLMFNIKDPRNQGLFRKILKGKISPEQLVQMSTEELASVELAKWREQENQHNIDLIKRTQIEQLQGNAGVRKKTHKGEIEIEEDAIGLDPTEIDKEVPKTPPRPVEETIEVTPEKKEEKKEKETDKDTSSKDTTSLHRSHLFDLNCKICTGKMAPPPPEELAPKKIRVAHSISVEHTSPKVSEGDTFVRSLRGDTLDEPEKKHKKAEPSVWKGFIYMQDVAKFVTSAYKVSGPAEFLDKDIPDTIQVCGRIVPDQVWDYLSKIKQSGNKELIVVRFRPANEEEATTYDLFYNYLNSRKRCGVVNNNYSKMLKDFYILPLAAHKPVPNVLMPFNGPGLPSLRPHLLLGVLVRHRMKQKEVKSAPKPAQEKTEDVSYTPPLEGNSYTPPLEGNSFTPPLDNRSYTPPLDTFTPPSDKQSYTPPLDERSYTPPIDDMSYTPPPPIDSSPGTLEISPHPLYTPTRAKCKISPDSGSNSHRTSIDEPDMYEPSYTPPLEHMPKMETDSSSDDSRQYKPGSNGQNPISASHIMRAITGNSSRSSQLTAAASSSSDLEHQQKVLNELTRKLKETEQKVCQSLSEIQQLDTDQGSLIGDNIANFANSGMSSFFNLPTKNLKDILKNANSKPGSEADGEKGVDSTSGQSDTDFRTLFNSAKDTDTRFSHYSPAAPNDPDSDRGSSLGGTPRFVDEDDENSAASELRPSDPRIKIRTNFTDDSYAPEEPKKTSLSDMSMSELVERAQKELETISTSDKNGKNVGHYPIPCWESSKEPPPPGIDPSDLPPIESVSFPRAESSNQLHPSYPPAQPPLPENHTIGASYVPPTPPTTAFPPPMPPPGFPIHAPPPTIDVSKGFPPPSLPPTYIPPPTVPPPPIPPPPEDIDQRDNRYYPWPPEGPPPPDVDYRDPPPPPPHWDEWDRHAPYDSDRAVPPPEYFRDRDPPEDWHFSRRRRDFHPDEFRDGVPPWSEEDWDREPRYEGRRPRRWHNRPRVNRRGRRNFHRPSRD